jgi:polyphosphate kinase
VQEEARVDGTSTGAPASPLSDELSRLRVVVDEEGEPTLLRPEGTAVDTWREGYPYPERMTRAEYDV